VTEAQLMARLSLDWSGDVSVDTGLPALDHLLGVLARYGRFDLALEVAPGSAQAQIEAAAQALGEVLHPALREPGVRGHAIGAVPADEALASVALDVAERPRVVSNVDLSSVHVAGLGGDVIARFLDELAAAAGIVLHVRLELGEDERHVLDSIFKALGAALGDACRP
jgi:imidazoleglycerol-phosphate dehydratase